MKPPTIIFIERLTCVNLLFDVMPYWVQHRLAAKGFLSVMVVDHSPAAWFMLSLLKSVGDFQAERVDFRIEELRTDNGCNARLKVYYQSLEGMIQDINASLKQAYPDAFVRRFLLKQFIHYDYDGRGKYRHFIHAALLVEVAAWYKAHRLPPGGKVNLWLYRRWFFKSLITYATLQGIQAKAMLFPYLGVYPRVKKYLGQLLHWVKQQVARLSVAEADKYPCYIATDYYGHLNLDKPGCYSDLFFTGFKPFLPVKIAFNLPSDPLTAARLKELAAHQVGVIVRNARADKTGASLPVEPQAFPDLGDLLKGNFIEANWINQRVKSFEVQKAYWKNYFQRHKIKLYVHWFKFDETHIPMAAALRELGGIMVIYQRAYESHPTPEVMTCADVVFGFHPAVAAIEQANYSSIRYHVSVGYPGDFRFALLESKAAAIRAQLLGAGAKHIIAFLDENTIDDGRWFYGHAFTQQNYAFILEKILADKNLGLVLKPKAPRSLRRRLGAVNALLDQVIATKRCVLIEEGTLQGAYPPAVAALAADVTIHEFANAATAGLESVLCGKRTVFMDLEGWPISPFCQAPEVVFDNWPQMWEGLTCYLKDPQASSCFGNCASLLDQLDPYRDGRAAGRIHDYLYFLWEGLAQGQDADALMQEAAVHFASQWGDDKIIRGIHPLC